MAKVDLKAKAKRQKIVAAVLGVILLGVLAYELPSVLKSKKPPPSAVAAPATPAPAAPVAGAPAAAPATPSGAGLADSDPAAQAAGGQLVSFDRFASKDPFAQQLDQAGKPAPPPAPAVKRSPKPKVVTTPPPTSTSKAAAPTSAKISVNGSVEAVGVGQEFPQADPVFRLVSLTRKTAKVGIAGGSLSSGSSTVTLTRGKKVTLMNTADGTRYTLVLLSAR